MQITPLINMMKINEEKEDSPFNKPKYFINNSFLNIKMAEKDQKHLGIIQIFLQDLKLKS